MKLWQGAMISLARNEALTRFMQERAPTSGLAARFVAGPEVADFVATARRLREHGFSTSAFFLGEYVAAPEKIAANVQGIRAVVAAIDGDEVDPHVSVDPSQIGYALNDGLGEANAFSIAEALADRPAAGRKTLMLDMEDESYVPRTLALHSALGDRGLPVAVTIQAYLRRSAADIERLAASGATVRLVKGAFVGNPQTAFTARRDIDASYRALAGHMLSEDARAAGMRPVFGTHDEAIIAELRRLARRNGWRAGEYEFEMLFGVRPILQQSLVDGGEAVRLYLPFGRDWWPYAIRRVGESPHNAWLVARALVSRG
jgi:proline dehydrogenase